ncbi:metalloregulator ArsR/SmtB family transcription factor [Paracidobacterium acidisoli]|uniref:Methyltransferase domain-containing protein n=1 Tax=Paracidobacterium acidisoli TaxID=2303751 RepID=A0A372IMJ1_9BACT|nr:metalloregulator ArsR/SmtB family transcription factor [Paracidobacterium acidisoli]MBT9331793.1 metalloregulator ArsR/SmtB family transcription factor [Paracidobacterium acidisoli]
MASIVKILRVLADPLRLRALLLLEREELSVAELQEILSTGQSTISMHLSQLRQAGLVADRRTGKNNLYSLKRENGSETNGSAVLTQLLHQAAGEIPEARHDQAALRLILEKRQDRMRSFFDEMAGRFGRTYMPGKSWKGVAEALLQLMPPLIIADLGAGEGAFSLLLAQRAQQVIAIDSSRKMVEYGTKQAAREGVANLEYRLGDLEDVPIADASVDVSFFSQSLHHALHPGRALAEAFRILKPDGRILVLDLVKHKFEEARELYADQWLGFSEVELRAALEASGFRDIQTSIVHREAEAPYFQTLLAAGKKAPPVSL